MIANLILNGVLDQKFLLNELNNSSATYAVDGAFNKISTLGLEIKAILGDLDSLKGDHFGIKTIELADQNFTDFDKAVDYLKSEYQEINVYGASGGELDHCLGNLFVASRYLNQVKICFIEPDQKYFITNKNIKLDSLKNRTISIIPFPKINNLVTKGLKFDLKNKALILDQMISVRNIAIDDEVTITFDNGKAAIFISSS